jgi:acetoacetyl-CoA synthetase
MRSSRPGIPHTVTGKRLEVPVKRLLQGESLESVVNLGAVDSAEAMIWYCEFAQSRAKIA